MANKIFRFSNTETQLSGQQLEVYRDLDIVAVRTVYPKPTENEEYKYVCRLITEHEVSPAVKNAILQNEGSAAEFYLYWTQFEDFELTLNMWRKNSRYMLAKNVNALAVHDSIKNIFTWLQGERILNPEFGCRLYKYLYEGITEFNVEAIISEVRRLVTEWEPRAVIDNIQNVSTIQETEDNTVHLKIIYRIPSLSNEQYSYSFVYNKSDG